MQKFCLILNEKKAKIAELQGVLKAMQEEELERHNNNKRNNNNGLDQ